MALPKTSMISMGIGRQLKGFFTRYPTKAIWATGPKDLTPMTPQTFAKAPNLIQVEMWFSILQVQSLQRTSFTSSGQMRPLRSSSNGPENALRRNRVNQGDEHTLSGL
jgi:hypothetical protein